MNSKLFGLFTFGILALVLVMSFASADIVFNPTSITQTAFDGTGERAVRAAGSLWEWGS